MKKILLIAALTMAAAPAMASKARITSLANSAHLSDTQFIFDLPWQTATMGEWATLEFGGTGTPNAEGGFAKSMGDGTLALYLGHQPAAFQTLVGQLSLAANQATNTAANLFGAANPLNIQYAAKAGDLNWGVNFFHMSSKAESATTAGVVGLTKRKVDVMGMSAGASNGVWDAALTLGLGGKGTATAAGAITGLSGVGAGEFTYTASSNASVVGGYKMENLYYWGTYGVAGGKLEQAGTTLQDWENNTVKIGVINSMAKDNVDFFYGVNYEMITAKQKQTPGDVKVEKTALPLTVGIEAEANSWLVLRGSIAQNLLIGETKTTVGTAAASTDSITGTTIAAGTGIKSGKFTLDTTLQAATTGTIGTDGANFLGNASLTYMF